MLVDKSNNIVWGSAGTATDTITYDTLPIPESLEVIDAVRITQTTSGQAGWRSPNGSNWGSYSVTPNGKVSMSAYVRNNTGNTLSVGLQLGVSDNINQSSPKYLINNIDVPADGKVHLITSTFEIPTGYVYGWSYVYSPQGTTNTDFTFGLLKVESGSVATPWIPSASEVTPSDYPNYTGLYVGKIVDGQSLDPTKYNWQKI